jgi:RNA polymerase sigma factor (sigma-70 family)
MSQERTVSEEFKAILDKFSGSIKASVLRYGLADRGIDPDDVLQEIRIKVWRSVQSEKKIRSQASYIKSVVNSTLVDCLRRSRRDKKLMQHEVEKTRLEAQGAGDSLTDAAALKKIIGEAADSLLESRRQVVKMFLLNMSVEEIAVSLNWSQDKARNLLYRGLSDMRKILKGRGIVYEDRQ